MQKKERKVVPLWTCGVCYGNFESRGQVKICKFDISYSWRSTFFSTFQYFNLYSLERIFFPRLILFFFNCFHLYLFSFVFTFKCLLAPLLSILFTVSILLILNNVIYFPNYYSIFSFIERRKLFIL